MASALTVLLAVVPDRDAPELRAEEEVLAVPDLALSDLEAVLPFPVSKLDLPLPELRLDLPLNEFEAKALL